MLGLNDAEVLQIVAIRMGDQSCHQNTFLDEIMEIDEAVMCLDKAEEKEVRQQQEAAKSTKAANLVFQERYRVKLVAVQAAQAAAAKAKAKPKAKARASPPPDPPGPLPQGDLTQAQIKHMCPPGGSVWRANIQGSWMGHYPPMPRISYSWGIYGHRYSAIKLLRSLWESWAVIHGREVPRDCPIEGLFQAVGEADAAAVVG